MKTERIGDLLLAKHLITRQQLAEAMVQREHEGGVLGRHLLLAHALSRRDLYAALAEQWELKQRDLVAEPPDPALAGRMSLDEISTLGWVPCEHNDEGELVIATSDRPTQELVDQVAARFPGERVELVATTDWDVFHAFEALDREQLLYRSQDQFADSHPDLSARRGLTHLQIAVPVVFAAAVLVSAVFDVRTAFILLLTIANVVFTIAILFKTAASIRTPYTHARRERVRRDELLEWRRRGLVPPDPMTAADDELPVYTILVPVFREANIIERLLANLDALDYPHSRLDVLLLMEENDPETVAKAKAVEPPEWVRLVVVPPGEPQTKPRACNYGLVFARGELVVIYDAEDRPEPLQLRKAVAAFWQDRFEHEHLGSTRPPLACVQAGLHYYNADYNVLTRMFAVEYAHWFESMLPGLEGTGIPLPLGGTSNHFDTRILRELGAWDPYNVTEDADLGMRAAVLGYRVDVLASTTGEEACSSVPAWIKQRTRWIKGYMITAAVNLRHPVRFLRHAGVLGMVGMIGLILGTPLSFLSYPLVLGFTVVTYVGVQFIGLNLPVWVLASGQFTMIFGNTLMIVVSGLAATRRYGWRIGIFALLNPVYWCLHAFAAWRALFQTILVPHRWEKTPHGLDEDYESSLDL
ncbi:MAG TPA: glycosyltransferase [Nocardioides sp.]|nr:glycosyltransferase [Nocardioides sp.]